MTGYSEIAHFPGCRRSGPNCREFCKLAFSAFGALTRVADISTRLSLLQYLYPIYSSTDSTRH